MVWFKVDDRFANHPKWMTLDPGDMLACIGLWTALGAWSAGYLTDGKVPDRVVLTWPDGVRLAGLLVDAGLLTATATGYQFHDWQQWQPTRAEVLAERERWRVNQENSRKKRGTVTDDTSVTHRGVISESSGPVPSRPLTLSNESVTSPKQASETRRADVEKLVTTLRALIVANGSRKPTITNEWRNSARLLLDRDRVKLDDAVVVMTWCQQDAFWKRNILSMPKFRQKFDRLRLDMRAAEREKEPATDPWAGVRRIGEDG